MIETNLPQPDPAALAHSRCVADAVCSAIASNGPLTLGEYMHMVLYAPGLGYYMTGSQKFGASGDFVTAPETTPLFGSCLAAQASQVLQETGGGILEIGAGSGSLAVAILRSLSFAPCLPTRYCILEPSAELAARQQQLLASELPVELFDLCCWLDALPDDFVGVVIANEVIDAMPVEQFVVGDKSDTFQQVYVTQTGGQLELLRQSASVQVSMAASEICESVSEPLPSGYCSELNLLLAPWLRTLVDHIQRGLLLLVDYGFPRREYYLPERHSGTLRCYFRHRVHDNPLLFPGLQDITSDVDFTRVAQASDESGFELHGYTSQAQFLLGTGLLEYAGEAAASDQERIVIAQQVKTLSLASEMGERFQVMGLSRHLDIELTGFSRLDLSYRL